MLRFFILVFIEYFLATNHLKRGITAKFRRSLLTRVKMYSHITETLESGRVIKINNSVGIKCARKYPLCARILYTCVDWSLLRSRNLFRWELRAHSRAKQTYKPSSRKCVFAVNLPMHYQTQPTGRLGKISTKKDCWRIQLMGSSYFFIMFC